MNTTHIHLLLNHIPIIGSLAGSGLLLWGIIKKEEAVKKAGAFILFIAAVATVPVYLTGEPAEESVEKIAGVSEAMIELHEGAATLALFMIGITGLASIAAILSGRRRNKAIPGLFIAACILSAMSFAAMARAGYYGGQIRHSEIRNAGTEKPAGNNEMETKDEE